MIMDYEHAFAQQGWQCPICKRVYSPMTFMCYYCGGGSVSSTGTGSIPMPVDPSTTGVNPNPDYSITISDANHSTPDDKNPYGATTVLYDSIRNDETLNLAIKALEVAEKIKKAYSANKEIEEIDDAMCFANATYNILCEAYGTEEDRESWVKDAENDKMYRTSMD